MARPSAALAALLALFHALHLCSPASMKKDLSRATANKTQALAAALQLDLRKNNDDYRDAPGLRNPYLGGARAEPDDTPDSDQGNALGPAPATAAAPRTSARGPSAAPSSTAASGGETKAASESAPAYRRSNNELHKLLQQEGLLTKFLRASAARRQRDRNWMQEAKDAGMLEEAIKLLDVDAYHTPPPETIPAADLDMLAGTGEHIETLKRRGRLCHRHILFPEGPKYDSKGKVYLRRHTLAQHFENTRRPRILLPRCCNCCKKSVLGCQ